MSSQNQPDSSYSNGYNPNNLESQVDYNPLEPSAIMPSTALQQPNGSEDYNQAMPPNSQSIQDILQRSKLAPRLLTYDAEIEPGEMNHLAEWKSAKLDENLLEARDRMGLHQCLQEKGVDLLLEAQRHPNKDPPAKMFRDMAFQTGDNKYKCGKIGCNYEDTAEHVRQHLHRKDHVGITFFPCTNCPSEFYRNQDLKRHSKECVNKPQVPVVDPVHLPAGQVYIDVNGQQTRPNARLAPSSASPYPKSSNPRSSRTKVLTNPNINLMQPAPFLRNDSEISGIPQYYPAIQNANPPNQNWQDHISGSDCLPINDLSQYKPPAKGADFEKPGLNRQSSMNVPSTSILSPPTYYGSDGVAEWQRRPQEPSNIGDVPYEDKFPQNWLPGEVRLHNHRDYWGVCYKSGGLRSGTVFLVVLTAFFVALVASAVVMGLAYLWLVDRQKLHPTLLELFVGERQQILGKGQMERL